MARLGRVWTEDQIARMGISISKKYEPVPEAGCWIWTGAAGRYGGIGIDKKHIDAHRASWLVHNGPIPEGMIVCHKCDTPLCINPDHLFVGTSKQNTHDMIKKGRQRYGARNPPRGKDHWTWRRKYGAAV